MRNLACAWLVVTCAAAAAPGMGSAHAPSDHVIQPGDDIAAAIGRASDGAVLELAAGPHRGPIVIDRPITLRGQPGARVDGGGDGVVLTITADHAHAANIEIVHSGQNLSADHAGVLVLGDHVSVSGLRVRQNLHGIYVRSAKAVQLRDNDIVGLAANNPAPTTPAPRASASNDSIHHNPPRALALIGNGIHLFDADQAVIVGNRIRDVRDGIYVAHTSDARFEDNDIERCRYGIHYMYSHRNRIHRNELAHNVAGAALMFSRELTVTGNRFREHAGFRAYGLLLQDVDTSTFEDNHIRANRIGLRLQNSNANHLASNQITGNITGLRMGSASRDNRFTRNHFGPNQHPVEMTGPVPPTQWAVDGVGNRWHGAMPLDLTGDGIADWPHHETDLLGARRTEFAPASLLTASPGVRIIEWALQRAPVPGMRTITDPHPIVTGHDDD